MNELDLRPGPIQQIQPGTVTPIGMDITPKNLDEAIHFADILAESQLVPKDYHKKPGNVLVAMQWGTEIGLQPMQALQNISVINGRPALWGDAALAIAYAHPKCDGIEETIVGEGDDRTATCIASRRGQAPTVRAFSVKDAMIAGLWGKNTWKSYPDRMLQMRARGFAIRDAFPDALKGMQLVEEVQDLPPERTVEGSHRSVPENKDDALAEKLRGTTEETTAEKEEPEPATEAPENTGNAYDSICEAINYIESSNDANEILDKINTSDLDTEPKRVLRKLVNAKMKKVTDG